MYIYSRWDLESVSIGKKYIRLLTACEAKILNTRCSCDGGYGVNDEKGHEDDNKPQDGIGYGLSGSLDLFLIAL